MGLWQGSDGKWLATAPTQRKQWPNFCTAIGREDLNDPAAVFVSSHSQLLVTCDFKCTLFSCL